MHKPNYTSNYGSSHLYIVAVTVQYRRAESQQYYHSGREVMTLPKPSIKILAAEQFVEIDEHMREQLRSVRTDPPCQNGGLG